jgi:DNA-binding CsgD family transcriptional regulator
VGASQPPGASLVGREAEVTRVRAVLERSLAGESSTLLVAGTAGVGKTALVDRSLAQTDVEGAVVLQGVGLPLTVLAAPFRTVRGMLRDAPPSLPSPWGERGPRGAVAVDPVEFDRWLEGLAAQRAVVLVVDDLHWVDGESLDILRYVIAGHRHRPVGVVLTLRSEQLVDGHPLHRWLADVRRLPGFEQLDLDPLDRFATEQQMTGIIGALPQPSLVDEVFRRSQGIPYLTRLLVADLPASAAHLPVDAPPALEDAVLASWHGLSSDARRLTTVLAIAGQALTRSDLEELVSGRLDTERVPGWVAEAVDRAVLEPGRNGRYWFQHPLQAELLEQRADPADRRAWHRACAHLLARRLDGGPYPARVVAVADHFEAAGMPAEAFGWSLRVAQVLGGDFSDQDVVRALRRALALHPFVGADQPGVDELLWRLADATARLGDLLGELEAMDALLARAETERSPEELVEIRLRRDAARYLSRLGPMSVAEEERTAVLAGRCPGTWQEAMALARFALAALLRPAAVDDATHHRARRAAEDALRTAQAVGHDAALAFALATSSRVAYLDDDLPRAREWAALGCQHAAEARNFPVFTLCTLMEANSVGVPFSGEVRDLLVQRRAEAVRLGAPHPWVASLSQDVARVSLVIGDTRTADEMVRFSLGAAPGPLADVGVRLAATRLAVLRGRIDEARQHWARVGELVHGRFDGLGDQSIRAELLSASGDHWEAFTVCRQALARGADHVTLGEWLLPLAARALADLAEDGRAGPAPAAVEDARRWLEAEHAPPVDEQGSMSAIPLDGSPSHPRYLRQQAGLQAWYSAELARASAADDTTGKWHRAAGVLDDAGLPWEAAYAWMRLGEAHLRVGRPDRRAAASALGAAVARGAALEAAPVMERVDELARSARISVPAPVQPEEVDEIPVLTPREREVLGHVVAGRTYAEIAEALVVSEKTVSSHISNMLRKTGVANRYQLADLARVSQRRTG